MPLWLPTLKSGWLIKLQSNSSSTVKVLCPGLFLTPHPKMSLWKKTGALLPDSGHASGAENSAPFLYAKNSAFLQL
jgi:hypothetical protein